MDIVCALGGGGVIGAMSRCLREAPYPQLRSPTAQCPAGLQTVASMNRHVAAPEVWCRWRVGNAGPHVPEETAGLAVSPPGAPRAPADT